MSKQLKDKAGLGVDGHVLIKDAETGEVLLDKHNAINFENFALAVANLLAGKTNPANDYGFTIAQMAFGNGGTIIDSTGVVNYKTPNVDDPSGYLYSETYRKDIDNSEGNTSEVIAWENEFYSDVVITATLDYAEPADQLPTDSAVSNNDTDYIFDEIGLVTTEGSFLTHLIFHPIHKSANRKVQVIYTLRIRAGQ